METISIAVAGFSAVCAVVLFFAYLLYIELPHKSAYSVTSCAVLLAALATLQIHHLWYFQGGHEPLASLSYRAALFTAPTAFYYFSRWVVFPSEPFRPVMLLHLAPIAVLFLIRLEIALPILFLWGVGYSLWLGNLVYGLQGQRRPFRFELAFFGLMSVIAVIVLVLGFSIPYIDDAYFYLFYSNATGLAFAIVVAALIAMPNLMAELSEAARVKYGVSTLRDVDVAACLKRLDSLMSESKVYQNEELSLASLAEQVGLSGHQLSELINSKLGVSFSRYVRERRVAAAKELLLSAPGQSILSISIDTGFRSQSNFYAAFKEVTGQSPGDFRKAHAK